jgi:hypothetical protein
MGLRSVLIMGGWTEKVFDLLKVDMTARREVRLLEGGLQAGLH